MAELTKPAYSPNLRLNIPTARVSGSVPTSSSSRPINTGQKESHNAQMAKIAIDGIAKLEDAYVTAEMQRVRHEMDEETVKLNKHIKDQEAVVADNLSTMNATFLDPRGVEDNFNADGITVGGNKLTPYEVSDDLSDKAKELIQPAIDLANNNFSRDTQTKFSGELTKRSNARIKVNYKKRLSNFQDVLNDNTRDKTKDNSHVFKPDGFQPAIDAVNAWEKELREEMKYKSVNEETLEMHVHQMKQDLAGMILNHHLTQNPKEGYNAYLKNKHSVMGVAVDPKRVGKFLEAHVKKEYEEEEREKDSAFLGHWELKIGQNPEGALKQLTKDTEENRKILSNSMNGQLKWEESDLKNLVPNFDLITENSRWKKSTLIKAVIAAVGGRDNMIAQSKQRQSKLFESKLGSDLEASNPSYVKGKRRELYDWNKNKGQWIPKEEAIHNFSKEWRLPKENVESIMLNRIKMAGIRDSAPGAGLINDQFLPYQNSILQWHRDHIFIDRGLGDSFDSTNPRKTLKGGQIYDSLSGPQQDAIDTMITELEDLKSLQENYKSMTKGQLVEERDKFNTSLKGTDNRSTLANSVWKEMKNNFYNARIENLRRSPVRTALVDLGYYDYRTQRISGKLEADKTEGEVFGENAKDFTVKYSTYIKMQELGVWPKNAKFETFLAVPEETWQQDLMYLGANKQNFDQIKEAEKVVK